MKKLCALILALLLALSSLPALAVSTGGKGGNVARNGELAAFMDSNGYIYISGLGTPVNATKADRVLTIDPYRIIFFAAADSGAGIASGRLVSIDLSSFAETILTDDALAACADGDSLYYISNADPSKLVKIDLDALSSETIFTASEALERIYISKAGVVTTLVDGAGAYIQDSVTGAFLPFNGDIAADIAVYDGFELYLTDSNNLYVQQDGLSAATFVDSSVQDWAVIGSSVYYLSGSGSTLALKSYNIDNALYSIILRPAEDMEVQLTASENALFMLSKSGTIYSVDVNGGQLVNFATLPSLSSYAMGNGKTLESFRIEAVSGQLNVYGVVSDANSLPTFTFVNSSSQLVEDVSDEIMLLSAYAINGESTVWDLLQPASQYSTLRKGSRGDAVKAIQQPLYDLNYYDYYIDGIFGWRTERAIRLLQADLDMDIDGVADEELQRIILSGTLEAYDPYRSLERGDRGYRVQEMQERLRDLGYLADDADGIFGSRTQEAVELFQSENSLRASGTATSDTLRKLYSGSAIACSSYIDLQRGDTGYRVRELNRRLKDLYYLEGDVGSSYNSATAAAVQRFQEEVGLSQSGRATVKVQQRLFSKNAPAYSGYISLQRGDDNDRVKDMQLRLVELGYHIGRTDGYFDRATRDAVKLFQRAIGAKATGVADPDTLEALYDKNAPAYHEPEAIGDPIIELSAYSRYADGIYYIADSIADNGNVTVNWFAEGDVASYDVRISDDRGSVYADDKGLSPDQTAASIPITSLSAERTYTVSVTAYSADSGDEPTYASIRFVRVLETPEPEPDEVGTIGKLIVTPVGENISRKNNVYLISGDSLRFIWSADGDVAGYSYEIADADGNVILPATDVSDVQEVALPADEFAADTTYELLVRAVPVNGTLEDATAESISFRRNAEPVATPEATQTPEIPEPTNEPAIDLPDATEEPVATPVPTEEPVKEPAEEPTIEPTEEPVEEPTAEPTEEPLPEVGIPVLSIEPYEAISQSEVAVGNESVTLDIYEISVGDLSLSWPAENAAEYDVQILDFMGNLLVNQTLTSTSAGVNSAMLEPGSIYTLSVVAHSAYDGSASEKASLYFTLPIQTESDPAPVDEYYDAESIDEAIDETPAENEYYDAEPIDEAIDETPAEDEYYDVEPIDEAIDEAPAEEPVEAQPEEEAYPTDDPSAWTDPITPDSDFEAIEVLQERLVEWKWLEKKSFEKGALDEATVNAVLAFQNTCLAYGLNVELLDVEQPEVGVDTLWLLFNADGTEFVNPEA